MTELVDPLPIEPLGRVVDDTVSLPGSKSITNRALVCAALADGPSVLRNVLRADDTEAMIGGLRALGIQIDAEGDRATVWGRSGRLASGDLRIDAQMSGTTARFLLPVATLTKGKVTIDGSASLRARPMGDSAATLVALGASVSTDGALPITVSPDPDLDSPVGAVTVRGDVSSQFLTGLLLVAPALRDGLEVSVDGLLRSIPYVDMTIDVMRAFGARVEVSEDRRSFAVEPTGYQHCTYEIEPDASAASYFFALAALCGGSITVQGLGTGSLQGDARFAEVLGRLGAAVEMRADSITVTGSHLLGGTVDMSEISDTAQTLAAIAPFAEGPITITGIGFIRHKETDRIRAVVTELQRLGVDAREAEDGLRIVPGAVSPGVVQTYDDHRMAMSFAILGLAAPGIQIADPACVSKTFPGFWETLSRLRGHA